MDSTEMSSRTTMQATWMKPSKDHLADAWKRWNREDNGRKVILELDSDSESDSDYDEDPEIDPERCCVFPDTAPVDKSGNKDSASKPHEIQSLMESLTNSIRTLAETIMEYNKRVQYYRACFHLPAARSDPDLKAMESQLEQDGSAIDLELSRHEVDILKALHNNPITVDMVETIVPAYDCYPKMMHKLTTNIGWFYSRDDIPEADVDAMLTHLLVQRPGDLYATGVKNGFRDGNPSYFERAKDKIEFFTQQRMANKAERARNCSNPRAVANKRGRLRKDLRLEKKTKKMVKEYDRRVEETLKGYCDCVPIIERCKCEAAPPIPSYPPPAAKLGLVDDPQPRPVVRLPRPKPIVRLPFTGKPKLQETRKVGIEDYSDIEKHPSWAKTKLVPRGNKLFLKKKHGPIKVSLPRPGCT